MITAMTIGNFDGVHRGHAVLIGALTEWKRQQPSPHKVKTVVVTFEPHPTEVITGRPVPRLSTIEEKITLIQRLGIDEVRVIPFTREFAATPARAFFDELVVRELRAGFVAIGHDFNFGRNRDGNPERMMEWCRQERIPATLISGVESDGAIVSSSRIRKLITEGHMITASRLLGRDYAIAGEVAHGDERGRLLGFPTANLGPFALGLDSRCIPARGVYLSSSTVEDRTFPSVTNVGVKPTVSDAGLLTVETHLLDFTGELYGKRLTVEFRDRLRDERKFSGLDELKEQIQKDISTARHRLTTL